MRTPLFSFGIVCLIFVALTTPAAVLYVDLNSPHPVLPYAGLTTAAPTIQEAVEAATNGDLVLVNDGVYQTGFQTNVPATLSFIPPKTAETNRVALNKPITVQSLHGPAVTVIDGGGIYRCVYLTNGAMISGFTLTNGFSGWIQTKTQNGRTTIITNLYNGGGASGSVITGGVVSNCVVTGNVATGNGGGAYCVTLINCLLTNNTANGGGGAANSTLFNCLVVGNHAHTNRPSNNPFGPFTVNRGDIGGGIYFGSAFNCVIAGNIAYEGGGVYGPIHMINCTVVSNSAVQDGGISFISSAFNSLGYGTTNCIIYYNSAATNANFNPSQSLDHTCTFPQPNGGIANVTNEPGFVNLSTGDFHLAANSLLINAGANFDGIPNTDLDGKPRVSGGTVDIGAFEFQSPASLLSYAWARQYGLVTDGSADFADTDGDGQNNWQEFVAGTDPTNAASLLKIDFIGNSSFPKGIRIIWQTAAGKNYVIQRSTNLFSADGFVSLQTNTPGSAGAAFYYDTTATNPCPYFYRIGVQ